ncbi:MAG: hypothetical protein RLW87_15590 [Alphaproteobacteria bacterium]
MKDSVVIDACSIAEFQKERIGGELDVFTNGMEYILENFWIALDGGDLILQEWIETASCSSGDVSLSDWVGDLAASGKLLFVSFDHDKNLNSLLNGFGFPRKDRKYIMTAISSNSVGISTEDFDFHDPKGKNFSAKKKEKTIENGGGPVAKMLKRKYRILVCSLKDAPDALG